MLSKAFLMRMQDYLAEEYDAFLKSYGNDNIRGINLNSKYLSVEKFNEIVDFKVKPILYFKGGYYLAEDMKMGYHPLHHAGAFYMQDPSAMLPPYIIDFPSDSLVLDLCASPGGKSFELSNQLTNGILISNEIDYKRAQVLASNIERMGLSNVIVTNNKPDAFLKDFKETFDVILVDAPCSGEGMFRKYADSCEMWSLDLVEKCFKRDLEIVDTAYQLLKKNGLMIYSTCTFSKEENENIVSYLCTKYKMEILPIKEQFVPNLKEGFIKNTYRFYPHISLGEGQFMAALKKTDGSCNCLKKHKGIVSKELNEFAKKALVKPLNNIIKVNNDLYYTPLLIDYKNLNVLSYGVKLGSVIKGRLSPFHHFFKGLSEYFISQVNLNLGDIRINKYLHGEQITADCPDGYGVLLVNGVPLGGYKAKNGLLNNLYPKGLRNF